MTTIALQHKLRAISLPAVNFKFVYMLAVVVLFLMLVFYVYSINTLTGGSYVIKGYNKTVDQLQQENNSLEAGFAASGFMGSAQQKARVMGFEKTTQVTYIEIMGGDLAQAR